MEMLSIIIPCFNEAGTIESVVRRVEELALPIPREIIISDDGSTDGSGEIGAFLKRAYRSLYLRPSSLLRQLRRCTGPRALARIALAGAHVVRFSLFGEAPRGRGAR